MTELEKNYQKAAIVEVLNTQVAECGSVVEVNQTESIEEKEIMFELESSVITEYGDRTYETEHELRRFLSTLTEAQLAETEVIVDDDTFVVFYPLLPARTTRPSGYHFDTDYPRPTVASNDVPELVGIFADQSRQPSAEQREAGLAILLASVRL